MVRATSYGMKNIWMTCLIIIQKCLIIIIIIIGVYQKSVLGNVFLCI